MEAYLRSSNLPITSLESQKPLNSFDIIGFSLLYELNFTNILTLLDLANIPFFSSQRDLSYPVIIGGGPCTSNPEPVADFFDAMVIGDGEQVITKMAQAWFKWKDGFSGDKEALLKLWSEIEGVYIPAFFEPEFDGSGFQTLLPRFSNYKTVTRAIIDDLDKAAFPDTPVVPYGKPVHDRLRIEVARGCTRGCRFCQAGMIYRPVRERSVETLLHLSETAIAATGYEDLSLLSLSTGDYSSIATLMELFMAKYEKEHIAVSLPSLRAGTLTPELMAMIKKVRKTGFTIAPEAGSQRLRNVINKNITKKDIFDTVDNAFALGWSVIKLYFMIGLPTETDDDVQQIIDLVKDLRRVNNIKKQRGKINVSVATFIPKSHTPFQWASQISLAESKEKILTLKKNLKIPGVHFKWQDPEVSLLEGLWARGDRRLDSLLVAAYKKGCKFDGWSDKFQYRLWEEALSDAGIDIDFYTNRTRDMAEHLPWDHINTKITNNFLEKEWEKALNGELTQDCRNGDCNHCGICDFKVIEPKVFDAYIKKEAEQVKQKNSMPDYKKLKISYSKRKQAKYFGHLELVNIFIRAVRRASITVKYSEGFHPKPKLSFDDPLPVGMESLNECLYLFVPGNVRPCSLIKDLNDHLPEGLVVHDCQLAPVKKFRKESESVTYLITIQDGFFDEKKFELFTNSHEFIFTRTNRKGKLQKIDLKDIVLKIDLPAPNRLQVMFRSESGKIVRPSEFILKVFDLSEEKVKQMRVIKI